MYKRRIIFILFFIVYSFSFSQEVKYDKTVDTKTYELFVNKKYEEMLIIADSAFDAGIDFYYLRMRAGIAYYDDKNYMSAIPHFQKALMFNGNDTIGKEYLYYSYLFSGLNTDANVLARDFPSNLKNKVGYRKPEFIKGLYTEGGYLYNGEYDENKDKK